MSEQAVQQQTKPLSAANRLPEFTVEFGDDSNRTITLDVFQTRVRGRWQRDKIIGRVLGAMGQMPDIPGIRMRVVPKEKKVVLYDPLDEDAKLMSRINATWSACQVISTGQPFRGLQDGEHSMGEHQMRDDEFKTLLFELRRKEESGALRVIEGRIPDEEAIEQIAGRKLYDLWNRGRHPKYEDEVPEWITGLEAKV